MTVDHGLREGAAAEAAEVARACAALGVPHDTLRWDGAGHGNLQARAREARRSLIGAWAVGHGIDHVVLGHTADDVAETVLLRLARGSGVDGLAGMSAGFWAAGTSWGRPLLPVTREALRDWLRARGIAWAEDPSNADPRFDRARARALMGHLEGLGLTRARLLRTAGHMARARRTLTSNAADVARREVRQDGPDLLLTLALLSRIETDDAPGRLFAAGLMWVGGRPHRPRYDALLRLAALLRAGRAGTLAGCHARPEGEWARLAREAREVGPAPTLPFATFLRGAP